MLEEGVRVLEGTSTQKNVHVAPFFPTLTTPAPRRARAGQITVPNGQLSLWCTSLPC